MNNIEEKLNSIITDIENILLYILNNGFGISQNEYYSYKATAILNFQKFIYLILDACIIFIFISILVLIVGYIIDKNRNYNNEKIRTKIRLVYPINSKSGAEVVCKYWIWQREKKKIIETLITDLTVHGNKNSRHAQFNKKSKPIPFPFLREVYGLSKPS
ncbi:hypothetical protein N9R04_07225 [Staphylococcus sp. SQ8-PEA]|uniref:Uncharacterized protein n=1 Tax=Staphylococcus marylandisciuri TaxID=2981529 RepID=A0ABT2QRA3_9STAP|nr:hypothetical protein [Staphylococcus marylandisciuri]MCU5746509.1 hypothetical protein [Staphylococcus marylandisciuri]